jgi:menaquinone-dependent protoporphyrinogen IX oxidase
MRQIAKKAGAATDTSHDYVYTDWVGLDKFVDDLAEQIQSPSAAGTELPSCD